jgi:hypothetical protein
MQTIKAHFPTVSERGDIGRQMKALREGRAAKDGWLDTSRGACGGSDQFQASGLAVFCTTPRSLLLAAVGSDALR